MFSTRALVAIGVCASKQCSAFGIQHSVFKGRDVDLRILTTDTEYFLVMGSLTYSRKFSFTVSISPARREPRNRLTWKRNKEACLPGPRINLFGSLRVPSAVS